MDVQLKLERNRGERNTQKETGGMSTRRCENIKKALPSCNWETMLNAIGICI